MRTGSSAAEQAASAVAAKQQRSGSRTISDGSNRGKGRLMGATGACDRGGTGGGGGRSPRGGPEESSTRPG